MKIVIWISFYMTFQALRASLKFGLCKKARNAIEKNAKKVKKALFYPTAASASAHS